MRPQTHISNTIIDSLPMVCKLLKDTPLDVLFPDGKTVKFYSQKVFDGLQLLRECPIDFFRLCGWRTFEDIFPTFTPTFIVEVKGRVTHLLSADNYKHSLLSPQIQGRILDLINSDEQINQRLLMESQRVQEEMKNNANSIIESQYLKSKKEAIDNKDDYSQFREQYEQLKAQNNNFIDSNGDFSVSSEIDKVIDNLISEINIARKKTKVRDQQAKQKEKLLASLNRPMKRRF